MTTAGHGGRSPGRFFALTFALSVPFWALGAFARPFAGALALPLPGSALMFVCPGVAALVLAGREGGPGGAPRLLGRLLDVRAVGRPGWLLPTVLLMPAVMGLSAHVLRALGRPLPEADLRWSAPPLLLALLLLPAACEELGWTGYALDPLQERWGARRASVLLGLVWAAWHVVPYRQAGHPWPWIAWQGVATVALRVLTVWLSNTTGRSVLVASLFHASVNASTFLFPRRGSHYDPAVTGTLLAVTAALVALLRDPRTLTHRSPAP